MDSTSNPTNNSNPTPLMPAIPNPPAPEPVVPTPGDAMPSIQTVVKNEPEPVPATSSVPVFAPSSSSMNPAAQAAPSISSTPVSFGSSTPSTPMAASAPAVDSAPAPAPEPVSAPAPFAPSQTSSTVNKGGFDPSSVASFFTPETPSYQNGGIIAATEPITEPDPIPEPDPIEEALKAPFKAADPVPGSIGSAVSVPKNGKIVGKKGQTALKKEKFSFRKNKNANKEEAPVAPTISPNNPFLKQNQAEAPAATEPVAPVETAAPAMPAAPVEAAPVAPVEPIAPAAEPVVSAAPIESAPTAPVETAAPAMSAAPVEVAPAEVAPAISTEPITPAEPIAPVEPVNDMTNQTMVNPADPMTANPMMAPFDNGLSGIPPVPPVPQFDPNGPLPMPGDPNMMVPPMMNPEMGIPGMDMNNMSGMPGADPNAMYAQQSGDAFASPFATDPANSQMNPFAEAAANNAQAQTTDQQSFIQKNLKFIIAGAGAFLVLIIVVIIVAMSGSGNKGGKKVVDNPTPAPTTPTSGIYSCKRNYTETDLGQFSGALQGVASATITFDNNLVTNITMIDDVTFESDATYRTGAKTLKNLYKQSYEGAGLTTNPAISEYSYDGFRVTAKHQLDFDSSLSNTAAGLFNAVLDEESNSYAIEDTLEAYENKGYTCAEINSSIDNTEETTDEETEEESDDLADSTIES